MSGAGLEDDAAALQRGCATRAGELLASVEQHATTGLRALEAQLEAVGRALGRAEQELEQEQKRVDKASEAAHRLYAAAAREGVDLIAAPPEAAGGGAAG